MGVNDEDDLRGGVQLQESGRHILRLALLLRLAISLFDLLPFTHFAGFRLRAWVRCLGNRFSVGDSVLLIDHGANKRDVQLCQLHNTLALPPSHSRGSKTYVFFVVGVGHLKPFMEHVTER